MIAYEHQESAISISQVHKSFDRHIVLDEITLELSRGKTLALLGRNGAGKTTLIRMMLGLLEADQGSIRIAGLDPNFQSIELRQRVGYLAEDQQMCGWMTCKEICSFLEPFYPTWDAKLAEEYLERFKLPPLRRIDRLSKGQTIKLGLAASLAHRPEIVILDDPALGLDTIARKEFNRELISQLQGEERTVIYSSHLLDEVESVADEVAILHEGRIIRHSETEVLRETVLRVLIPVEATDELPRPNELLDVQRHGRRLSLVLDQAPGWIETLEIKGIEHEVVPMSLDEIFQSFVSGETGLWPHDQAERLSLLR